MILVVNILMLQRLMLKLNLSDTVRKSRQNLTYITVTDIADSNELLVTMECIVISLQGLLNLFI